MQELAVKCTLVLDPVAQLFVFPEFHICSSPMSMLEINDILELFISNFFMMVLFIRRFLFFAIICSLLNFNIAPLFLFRYIIDYLFLYIFVLLLFGCCHFWWRNEVWVQFILVRWLLQFFFYHYIFILFLYQTITLVFPHCTIFFFKTNWFIILHHFLFLSFLFHIQFS